LGDGSAGKNGRLILVDAGAFHSEKEAGLRTEGKMWHLADKRTLYPIPCWTRLILMEEQYWNRTLLNIPGKEINIQSNTWSNEQTYTLKRY
jgi:hypothetical protein